MRRFSLRTFCRPLTSALSSAARRFHSSLTFDSPLSISCTLCNYFTALGYYPFNLLLHLLFTSRPDVQQHCTDLLRFQLALLLLFILYLAWRVWLSASSRRGVREGSLLLLAALQLWVDWHGWHASKQAVDNLQAWQEADDEEWATGAHTQLDHANHTHVHQPVLPRNVSAAWLAVNGSAYGAYGAYGAYVAAGMPSYPYQLTPLCGTGFNLHLVRVSLLNVAFTAAVAAAFVLRVAGGYVSDEWWEAGWAVWDGGVERAERRWARLKKRAAMVRQRYQRRRQRRKWQQHVQGNLKIGSRDADSQSDSDMHGGDVEQQQLL